MSPRIRRLGPACVGLLVFGLGLAFGPWESGAAPAPESEASAADYARALKSKNAAVRKQVALALGEMGAAARAAVPALRAALLDEDEGVQAAAAAALEKIVPSGEKAADVDLVKQMRASLRLAEERLQIALASEKAAVLEARLAEKRAAEREAVARKEIDKLLADLKTSARNDVDRRKADVEDLAKLLREKEARLAEMQKQIADERDRAVAAQIEVKALKNRAERLEAQLQEATKELARTRAGGADAPAPEKGTSKNPPAGDVEGLVKAVDAGSGLLTLTVGKDAGVEKGHTLEVFRLDPAKYLGTVRIVEVNATQAVAQPLGKLRDPIQAGDRVVNKLK